MAQHQNAALRRQIGARLRELRVAAGVSSQEALAERAGIHRTYIGRVERGESGITVEALTAILAALDLSLAEFFSVAWFQKAQKAKTPRRRS